MCVTYRHQEAAQPRAPQSQTGGEEELTWCEAGQVGQRRSWHTSPELGLNAGVIQGDECGGKKSHGASKVVVLLVCLRNEYKRKRYRNRAYECKERSNVLSLWAYLSADHTRLPLQA